MSEGEVKEIKDQLSRMERLMLSQKNVLTFLECCQYTGWSASHLYKLTSRREVPHSKPGGKDIFFERVKIDEFLIKNPVKTKEEIEQDATKYILQKDIRRKSKF